MRYMNKRDENLGNKLQGLLANAARTCPDRLVSEMKKNHICYVNDDITEYVLVWFFDGRQVCAHRTLLDGAKKFGCEMIRVWERHLPNDRAVDQIGSEIHRMLGHRLRVHREVEEFERFALEYLAEGMKV